MAFNSRHISYCGAFNIAEKKALIKTFSEISAGTVVPTAAPAALTNSTGQVGNDTVAQVTAATAAVTDTTAASLASTNAAITIINADLADLTDKLNAMRTALRTSGALT